jgi:CHAD domain-containing protein
MGKASDGPSRTPFGRETRQFRSRSSVVLEANDASADVVIASVLDQIARNFLLNDLPIEQSGKLLEATRGEVIFQLGRAEARRRETDVSQVHQARVSVRRLRSVLQTFSGLFDAEWANPLLAELSWYAAVLGEIRDLDVLRSGIEESIGLVRDQTLQPVVMARLDWQIKDAHERGAVDRATKRYALLVDEIATIGTSISFDPEAKKLAVNVLSSQLNNAWRDVRRSVDVARDVSNNENLHDVRKTLKRLRYACEILGLVAGKPAKKVAKAAESTQTQLGVVHDEAVAAAWLKSLVVAAPEWKSPLRDIRAFHKEARKDAKRGWRDSIDVVERRWDELQG